MTDFLRDHWRPLALIGLLVAVFLAGRFSVRQEPAVHEVVHDHAVADTRGTLDETTRKGPSWTATLDFAPSPACGCPPGPGAKATPPADICRPIVVPGLGDEPVTFPAMPGEQLSRLTITRDGPSERETHAAGETHAETDHKLDLTITPQPLPRWELQLGVEDALAARSIRVAARLRILGPLWGEISVRPLDRSIGVAAAVAF